VTSLLKHTRIALLLAAFVLLLAPAAMADVIPEESATDSIEIPAEPAGPVEIVATPAVPDAPLKQQRAGQDSADVTVTGTSTRTVWAGGRNVEVASTSPDAVAAGEAVNLVGGVLDNFLGAGKLVQISGPVGGDAFLAGETIEVRESVEGDVYAIGETVRVPSGVTIGGNLYFGGAILDLDGTVDGDLVGGGADLMIDGTVHGDVRVDAANLAVGPNAVIDGDLVYESLEASESIHGTVAGDVTWTATEKPVKHHDEGGGFVSWMLWNLFFFGGALVAGMALLLLFPLVLKRPTEILEGEWPVSLGVGFAVLLGVPALALFLLIFVIPIPLSALAMAVWLPATYVARLVAAYAVGKLVLERGKDDKVAKPLGALAVGMVILHVLYAIPVLGFLLMMIATVFGLGALFLAARRAMKTEQVTA